MARGLPIGEKKFWGGAPSIVRTIQKGEEWGTEPVLYSAHEKNKRAFEMKEMSASQGASTNEVL